jgi:hypothetical protein
MADAEKMLLYLVATRLTGVDADRLLPGIEHVRTPSSRRAATRPRATRSSRSCSGLPAPPRPAEAADFDGIRIGMTAEVMPR